MHGIPQEVTDSEYHYTALTGKQGAYGAIHGLLQQVMYIPWHSSCTAMHMAVKTSME